MRHSDVQAIVSALYSELREAGTGARRHRRRQGCWCCRSIQARSTRKAHVEPRCVEADQLQRPARLSG